MAHPDRFVNLAKAIITSSSNSVLLEAILDGYNALTEDLDYGFDHSLRLELQQRTRILYAIDTCFVTINGVDNILDASNADDIIRNVVRDALYGHPRQIETHLEPGSTVMPYDENTCQLNVNGQSLPARYTILAKVEKTRNESTRPYRTVAMNILNKLLYAIPAKYTARRLPLPDKIQLYHASSEPILAVETGISPTSALMRKLPPELTAKRITAFTVVESDLHDPSKLN